MTIGHTKLMTSRASLCNAVRPVPTAAGTSAKETLDYSNGNKTNSTNNKFLEHLLPQIY